ncbi:MAG: SH3 domain-containing protein [Myxococcales bacterium]|nr:SH3 domain-containing protein [Myxococcales bacterium]
MQSTSSSSALGRVAIVLGIGLISLACAGMPEFPDLAALGNDAAPDAEEPPTASVQPELAYFYFPGGAGVDNANFSRWSVGDALFVGVDDSNLRTAPSTKGDVIDKLRLGREVEILGEAGEPMVLTGRLNIWYRVRAKGGPEGYLYGSVLSPLRVPLFQPGSDTPQVAVVTFNQAFGPRVRWWHAPGGKVHERDAEPVEAYTGGVMTAVAEPAASGEQLVISQCDPSSNQCVQARMALHGEELVQLE